MTATIQELVKDLRWMRAQTWGTENAEASEVGLLAALSATTMT